MKIDTATYRDIKNTSMKKVVTLLIAAFLGGVTSLIGYSYFSQSKTSFEASIPNAIPTNFEPAVVREAAENTNFTLAANKTIHAVVHIKNTGVSSGPSSIWDYFNGSGNMQRMRIGMGSGVIVSPDGYIITNNHVIEDAKQLEVKTNDNKVYEAELIGTDPSTDIAVLKIIDAKKDFSFVRFGDSDQTKIGEWVLAVGNPFNLTSTVTAGIISAKARDLYDGKNQSYIQTDAAVNTGNSGGALVNTQGDLIGINTAITSKTGSYVGYSFAVPSNIARKVFEDIVEYGDVQKGLLGVRGQSLNNALSEELEIETTEGFYVASVDEEMGAKKAGIQAGDIIQNLDGVKISKFSELSGYLGSKRPGDQVTVHFLRKGVKKTALVTLTKNTMIEFLNMRVKTLSKKELKKFDLKNGVKILNQNNPNLYRLGIRNGYMISHINGKPIDGANELKMIRGEAISDILFISPDGERERIIFD